ncbi:MAG: 4-(cytidine 5'-diphospho)-2-C-methyl-D-erythritol kinase [Betaproteobacteria bacterium]
MKTLYDLQAPAKLNTFLHIVGRRPEDGYHLLQSAFVLIDWHDTLHLELRHDGQISREDEAGPGLPGRDLCVRAAQALQAATGSTLGVHIRLHKRIPTQAGMGGGSSDAATCLLGLMRLWKAALPRPALMQLALGLGADVPFFLLGRHAWVEGVGERLQALDMPPARFLVLKPPVGLATPQIFASPELRRDSETATISGFAALGPDHIYEFGRNDLQPVAQQLCPEIAQGLQWLSERGLKGRMTGSGSALFARLPDGVEANRGLGGPADDWVVRVCSTLQMHPLADW